MAPLHNPYPSSLMGDDKLSLLPNNLSQKKYNMKIIYLGDVVGETGRTAVLENIDNLKSKYKPDIFIINGENSAHGIGITPKIADQFFDSGVDVITLGNHAFKKKEIYPYLNEHPHIIRPLNFPQGSPGKGYTEFELANGKKILIIQIQGTAFMEPIDNPFHTIDNLLKSYTLGKSVNAILVDIHAEATSEKLATGFYLDGRVSAVIGTHTHVPTSDARILPQGTAYQTDTGMCGDFNSVLGSEPEEPINRILNKNSKGRLTLSKGPGTVQGIYIETTDQTGLATHIEQINIIP